MPKGTSEYQAAWILDEDEDWKDFSDGSADESDDCEMDEELEPREDEESQVNENVSSVIVRRFARVFVQHQTSLRLDSALTYLQLLLRLTKKTTASLCRCPSWMTQQARATREPATAGKSCKGFGNKEVTRCFRTRSTRRRTFLPESGLTAVCGCNETLLRPSSVSKNYLRLAAFSTYNITPSMLFKIPALPRLEELPRFALGSKRKPAAGLCQNFPVPIVREDKQADPQPGSGRRVFSAGCVWSVETNVACCKTELHKQEWSSGQPLLISAVVGCSIPDDELLF